MNMQEFFKIRERVSQKWYGLPFKALGSDEHMNVVDEAEWIYKGFDDPSRRMWYKLTWGAEPQRGKAPLSIKN